MSTPGSELTDVVELRSIPIFRAGAYPQGTYDEAFLQTLADAYDPGFHEAPCYLDHEDDAGRRPAGNLAFGWVRNLYVKGATLFADLVNVPRQFADLVLAGRIKKRSVELYTNLEGKGPYLRALAWPMIPQVKALAAVHPTQVFHDRDGKNGTVAPSFVTIPFQEKESSMTAIANEPTFVTTEQLQVMLRDLKSELLAEGRKLQAESEIRSFCEQMVLAGKLAPSDRAVEEQSLIRLSLDDMTRQFSEGQVPLSHQRMDQIRKREPIIQTRPAAAPAAGELSDRQQKVSAYFRENEPFFTRMGVSLQDLLEAEKAQPDN